MKTIFAFILALSFASITQAHPDQSGVVVISKATELGAHRIERLVTLKKIDPLYTAHLYALRAERTGDSAAPYKVHGYVLPDAGGQSSTISMLFDPKGKALSHTVSAVYPPANAAAWPQKDAVALMEEALHFVIEGWAQNPGVKPFSFGLESITLSRGQDAKGNLIAVFAVTSDDDAKTLYIRLKPDGSFISHEIK